MFVSKRAESKEKLINNLKNNEEYLKNSGLIGEKKDQSENNRINGEEERKKQIQKIKEE